MRPFRRLPAEFFAGLEMERSCAVAAMVWGVFVIAAQSFDYSPAYTYAVLAAAPITGADHAEWLWGGLMVLAACLQIYGLRRDARRARMSGAILAGTTSLLMGLCFMLFNGRSTVWVFYGQLALMDYALYYQVGTGRRPLRPARRAVRPTPAPTPR